MTLESDAKFEEKLTCGLENNMRNLANFHQSTESLKIRTLMGFFCPKLNIYELKIYRGVMCYDNEEWCKNWRGTDFSVQNWHEEFDEFWSKHSKTSKICTLVGSCWSKYIMFELKNYRGVIFDGTEDWCKIWSKTDLCFLKWHEEFVKFSLTGWKIAISF